MNDKIAAIEKAISELRYARNDPTCPEHAAYNLLVERAAELRAQTPKETNRVLLAMADQINRARRFRAQHGYYDGGHAQTITEALCGRWWPVVQQALERSDAAPV